jgi:hypothetical protein
VDEANKVKQTPVKLGERTGDYVRARCEGPPAGSPACWLSGSSFTLDGDVIQPDRRYSRASAGRRSGSEA